MSDKERLEQIKNRDIKYLLGGTQLSEDWEWLINRVEELEEIKSKLIQRWNDEARLNNDLMEQNQRYKQALEFYADEESYEPLEVQIGAVTKEGYKISKYKYDPIINTDKGKKARETLGWEEEN